MGVSAHRSFLYRIIIVNCNMDKSLIALFTRNFVYMNFPPTLRNGMISNTQLLSMWREWIQHCFSCLPVVGKSSCSIIPDLRRICARHRKNLREWCNVIPFFPILFFFSCFLPPLFSSLSSLFLLSNFYKYRISFAFFGIKLFLLPLLSFVQRLWTAVQRLWMCVQRLWTVVQRLWTEIW